MQLTKEQAIKEFSRRLREERHEFYKPHPTQELFHQSLKPIRGIFAGNRWGKTYSVANEIIWHVTKRHPYWKPLSAGPVKARCCCVDHQTLKKVMIDDTFKILVPRRYLKGYSWDSAWSEEKRTLYFDNGGFIEFMSYNQEPEAFAGVARHLIWEDEEAPENIHRENMARLSTTSGILIITMTPVRPHLWVVSEIYEKAETDENIDVFRGNALENPYVDPKAIKMMLSQINDPVERQARLTGEFSWYAGKVYPDYGEPHRCKPFDPPDDWDLVVAIDPHPTKETAVTFNWWDLKGNMYVLDELWVSGSVEKIASEIQVMCRNRKPSAMLIDPASDTDPKIHGTISAYRKFVDVFPDLQKWVSKKGSVWLGILDVREMLRLNPITNLPKLFVCTENCPMTDWQMAHYGLKPPTSGDQYKYDPKPVKVRDDFCDCVRGAVMFGAPFSKKWIDREMEEQDEFGLKEYN